MGIKIKSTKSLIKVEPPPQRVIKISVNPPKIINIITNPVMVKGDPGLSNYELAIRNGLIGPEISEVEWLESLKSTMEWSSTNW